MKEFLPRNEQHKIAGTLCFGHTGNHYVALKPLRTCKVFQGLAGFLFYFLVITLLKKMTYALFENKKPLKFAVRVRVTRL